MIRKKKSARKAAKTSAKRPAKKSAKKTAKKPARKSAHPSPRAERAEGAAAVKRIDARIRELGDWRGEVLSRLRNLIRGAGPAVIEEWKWGVPVWSHEGLICTGETYKNVVKLTFAKGARLPDPHRLFNSSLEGNTRRAIDVREGEGIDETSLQALVREAAALNQSTAARGRR